jgi:plastocyanin
MQPRFLSAHFLASVLNTAVLCLAVDVMAGELRGDVTDAGGAPIANAVIALQGDVPAAAAVPAAGVMDQRDRQFAPHVLVVQRNASVKFPNSDDIRHQVYSFSPAKPFNLPLYHGVPAEPVTFDKAGQVVLGCNIHDQMLGYIVVVDTPWFGKSDAAGRVSIAGVPAGTYRARLWYPGMAESAAAIEKAVRIESSGVTSVRFDNAVAVISPARAPKSTRSWEERRERAR